MTISSKNLGFVKAIHVGDIPPTNQKMIWYNSGDNVHYYFDTTLLEWKALKFSASDPIEFLQFLTSVDSTTPLAEGRIRWNNHDLTFEFGAKDSRIQINQEGNFPIKNKLISTAFNGRLFRIIGHDSETDHYTIGISDCRTEENALVDGMLTHDVETDDIGLIVYKGIVRGLNTSAATLLAPAYLGEDGLPTHIKPIYPSKVIQIGKYGKIHETDGEIIMDVNSSLQERFNYIDDELLLRQQKNEGICERAPVLVDDIVIDSVARTLTITSTRGGTPITPQEPLRVYIDDDGIINLFEYSEPVVFTWDDIPGTWYFYLDNTGTPISSQTIWSDFSVVAAMFIIVYNTGGDVIEEQIEMHTNSIGAEDHTWKHTYGTIHVYGFDIVHNKLETGSPNADGRNTVISLTSGKNIDDNLDYYVENTTDVGYFKQDMGHLTTGTLTALNAGLFPIRSIDVNGDLTFLTPTRFPFKWDVATNRPQYITPEGVETLVPEDDYFVYYVYALQDRKAGQSVRIVSAETTFEDMTSAQAHTWDTLKSFCVDLRNNEIRPLYKLIFLFNQNPPAQFEVGCKYTVLREYEDYRRTRVTVTSASSGSVLASNVVTTPLSNLTQSNAQAMFQQINDTYPSSPVETLENKAVVFGSSKTLLKQSSVYYAETQTDLKTALALTTPHRIEVVGDLSVSGTITIGAFHIVKGSILQFTDGVIFGSTSATACVWDVNCNFIGDAVYTSEFNTTFRFRQITGTLNFTKTLAGTLAIFVNSVSSTSSIASTAGTLTLNDEEYWSVAKLTETSLTNTIFVDATRGDDATADGSIAKPYKTPEQAVADFNPVVLSFAGDITSGTNYITVAAGITANLKEGQLIVGTGIPFDTRIISLAQYSITLSNNVTATSVGESFEAWVEASIEAYGDFKIASNIYKEGITSYNFNGVVSVGSLAMLDMGTVAVKTHLRFKCQKWIGTHANSRFFTQNFNQDVKMWVNIDVHTIQSKGTGYVFEFYNSHYYNTTRICNANVKCAYLETVGMAINAMSGSLNYTGNIEASLGITRARHLREKHIGTFIVPSGIIAFHNGYNSSEGIFEVYGKIYGAVTLQGMIQMHGTFVLYGTNTFENASATLIGSVDMSSANNIILTSGMLVCNITEYRVAYPSVSFINNGGYLIVNAATLTPHNGRRFGIHNATSTAISYCNAITRNFVFKCDGGKLVVEGIYRNTERNQPIFITDGLLINKGIMESTTYTYPTIPLFSQSGGVFKNYGTLKSLHGRKPYPLGVMTGGIFESRNGHVSVANGMPPIRCQGAAQDIRWFNGTTNCDTDYSIEKGYGKVIYVIITTTETDTQFDLFDGTNTETFSVVGAGLTREQIAQQFVTDILASTLVFYSVEIGGSSQGLTDYDIQIIGLEEQPILASALTNATTSVQVDFGYIPNFLHKINLVEDPTLD